MSDDVPVVAGGRREARERAVHLLYEADTKTAHVASVLEAQAARPDPYAADLALGVDEQRAALDGLIAELATGWTLDRMPLLDLTVLRVGTFELLHRPEVPTAVVLSEATELASRYGTDDSSRFVNGVLAAAARRVRVDPPPTPPD
ncbi:MAG: transcription antitermination factor NusB [Acidobacteria bacterium]|nr:transcription antitermination factor NusB [Acidobacteriota bacterium]